MRNNSENLHVHDHTADANRAAQAAHEFMSAAEESQALIEQSRALLESQRTQRTAR